MSKRKGGLERGIGIVILGMALFAGLVLWIALTVLEPEDRTAPQDGLLFGVWDFVYDTQAPSLQAILVAVALALLLAAAVATIERQITNKYRRSADADELPLAPRPVMAATRGVFHGPVTVTALIPAHNEADKIGATLASLQRQHGAPERIVVVADNCTDETEQIALAAGVEVFRSVDNTHKKGGALNQALAAILPELGDNDTVLVMDADTVLDQGYLAAARSRFTNDRALMAVGGLFYGEEGGGLIGQFQRNEYTRYAREIRRRRGRVFVLTGTASVFRSRAMKTVADSRGTRIPGQRGNVYDTAALTEDNEITIALKSLGALIVSPKECTVVTEVMPTWRALWAQRLRWQRGALENLGAYGVTAQTARYWSQQLGIGYGVIALFSYFLLFAVMALSLDRWVWFPFWLGLGALFVVERVITAWAGGWRARLLGLTLFPELFYATFLNVVFVKGVVDIVLRREARWRHVVTAGDGKVQVEDGARR
ncbi:glycosyltransferase [Epidermidibacterium keratini]|uniref:Glycosyltransferase n=1 Tax=Epidermidibacterium keratini TaxID=1891644 RepID=A0A7L4YIG3_9ACTN|nr:glycosyltransferase family 2 protein [Epidermidibacterium keratini]QHB99039.1 glycosyltransferase [Epidermidibacterium keratini]